MDHGEQLRQRLRGLPLQAPPIPWKQCCVHAVGGLSEVGFGESSDFLLVVSSTGRGVFNCLTGEKVARDYEDVSRSWYDPVRLTARGIGPLEARVIRLAGAAGGGLPLGTADGWSVEMLFPDWPDGMVVLNPPGMSVLIERFASSCVRLLNVDVPRAHGFSETGRSLVIAQSHSLHIYCRE